MAPWTTIDQVEQDLLLARLIIEIANDEYLGDELVFRGGTCLHKLRISPPMRYSEDLDYVRRSDGGIGELVTALRRIGERLGMKVNYEITRYPKVRFSAPFESGNGTMKIKIEVNTFERSPAKPQERVPFIVESGWYTGTANVQTFATAELLATKIRALYQRSKGRDLFDLWLGLTRLGTTPHDMIDAFGPYRPEGITRNPEANGHQTPRVSKRQERRLPALRIRPVQAQYCSIRRFENHRMFSILFSPGAFVSSPTKNVGELQVFCRAGGI